MIGGDFVNKGAEAMILSTQAILNKYFVNPEIIVATYEKKNIGSKKYPGLKIIGNKWLKGKAILYAKAVIPVIGTKLIKGNLIKRYEQADVIINIGGFSISDKQSIQGNIVYCIEIMLSKLFNKPFIAFPQDMGPFKTMIRRFFIKRFLPNSKLIVVRSKESKKYLEEIGIKNVHITPDLAFILKPSSKKRAEEILAKHKVAKCPFVCIIPNMRVYERNKKYVDTLSSIVNFIVDKLETNVLFLSHEFKKSGNDDRFVINKVIDNIKNKNKVFKITEEYSAPDLKAIISKADILISSRFHGAIAGLSICVPTIVIGWAHKYKELMTLVKQEKYSVDYQDVDIEKIMDKVNDLWKNKTNIKKDLESIILKIKKDAEQPALLLKGTLSEGIGKFKDTYVGYSKDKNIRAAGQSGGLVSALLIYALEKKMIDGAIVTRWSKKDPLLPETFIARSKEEILQAAKSKYCPVKMSEIFRKLKHIKGNFAFVGVPCQLKALKKLEKKGRIQAKISFYFGLFCDRTLTFKFQDYILSVIHMDKKDVKEFTYRSKEWRGWPGDIQVKLKDGTVKNIPKEYRMKVKPLFTIKRCWNCSNKTNKLSDISFGDAWLPEFRRDKLGTSLIVSRTKSGEMLLEKAKHDDVIELDKIDSSKIKQELKKRSFIKYVLAKIKSVYFKLEYIKRNG